MNMVTVATVLRITTSASLEQYTPDQASWGSFLPAGVAHDPDSVSWLNAQDPKYRWDGFTIYSPSSLAPKEFVEAICPSVDLIRGIREVFYQHNPFADNMNPTKAEVDEWHRIAINHARALVGYVSEEHHVKKDHCMFARALWGDQRKYTTMWDAKI